METIETKAEYFDDGLRRESASLLKLVMVRSSRFSFTCNSRLTLDLASSLAVTNCCEASLAAAFVNSKQSESNSR